MPIHYLTCLTWTKYSPRHACVVTHSQVFMPFWGTSRAKEAYQSKKSHLQGPADPGALEADRLVEISQQAWPDVPNLVIVKHHAEALAMPSEIESDSRVCKQHFDQDCYWCFTHWNKAQVELQSNDDSLPLAQQRPCHLHHQLPACYRDLISEPPRLLPPSTVAQENPGKIESLNLSCLLNAWSPPHLVLSLPSRPKIKTQLNTFSLFWLYDEDSLPLHNPDTDNLLDGALSALCKSNSIKLNEGITDANNPTIHTPMRLHCSWGICIGIRDIRSPRWASRSFSILSGTWNITLKMYEIWTGWWSIVNLATVLLKMTQLRRIANGWMVIVDGRWWPSKYAPPSITVLSTLGQRIMLSRTFITVPWWISFMRMYQILVITSSSIMNHMSSTGSHPTRPRM